MLHDASLLGTPAFDDRAATLAIAFAQAWEWGPMRADPAWAPAPRTEVVRRRLLWTAERVPQMRGLLVLRQVTAFEWDPGIEDAG